MSKVLHYHFYPVERCNMCHAGPEHFRIMGRRLNTSQGYNPRKKTGILVTVKQCTQCKLVFSDPMPIPDRFEDHYGLPAEEYWKGEAADWWHLVPEHFVHNRTKFVKHLAELGPSSKMLDIGAGAGQVMKAFLQAGYDVHGIEPSEPFRNYIIEKMGVSPDRIHQVSIEDATFPEGSFDFIHFAVVLEHLADPSAAMKKAVSWLKPNGVLYVQVPSSNWLFSKLLNTYFRLIGTELVTNLSPMHEPYHLYEFSHESFRRNGAINGYECKVIKLNPGANPLPKIFTPLVNAILRRTNTVMQFEVFVQRTK